MAGIELPDWLRGFALIGRYGSTYLPVAVDENGVLYIVLTGTPEIAIPGTVDINDLNTLKQIQGSDGTQYRTAKVDANGQFIIVPRGQSGNYMAVSADGYLSAILKGVAPDASLVGIKVDADGQLVVVFRGASGNYADVDSDGYLTTKIQGSHAGTPTAVAVDADGNLVAVMNGAYGSALMTVAVDYAGHLVSVITDEIDMWGQTVHCGISELAARLGSPFNYDRRGQCIYLTDFSAGMGEWTQVISHDGYAKLVVSPCRSSGYAVLIYAGSVNADSCSINCKLGALPVSGNLGMNLWANLYTFRGFFQIWIKLCNGGHLKKFGIRLNWNTGDLAYWSSGGTWTNFGVWAVTFVSLDNYTFWNLVVDIVTGKYVRLVVAGTTFDLSSYSCQDSASSDVYLTISVEAVSYLGGLATLYVDDVVLAAMVP
jgi:hypothetical protein